MKTITQFIFLILIGAVATLAQPKIEIFGGEMFDFGEMYKGDKVDRKVTVQNTGTQTLVIDRVQASCGCTATLLEEKNIPPGKTTLLSIGFDSKNFNGEVHKSVTVFSNDPNFASKEIRFKAFIKEVLTATPPYIFFTTGKVDSAMTSSGTLKNMSDETIRVLSVSSNTPEVKFDLKKKSIAPGETTQFNLIFTPSKAGYVNHDIVIKTSHAKQKELTMKMGCNVLRPAAQSFETTGQNK